MLVLLIKHIANPSLSFVHNHYCKSASWYPSDCNVYYFNDTLRDGAGCVELCVNPTQPWLHHQLSLTTQDDIEARISM